MLVGRRLIGRGNTKVIFVMLGLASMTIAIAAATEDSASSRVPQPDIPKGQTESCVEETEFMRRNHMNLLLHQRDETVLRGKRDKQHSLRECVSCHAVHGEDGIAVTATNQKHFCRSCHDYAAVKIDCFQCHASRPDSDEMVREARLK